MVFKLNKAKVNLNPHRLIVRNFALDEGLVHDLCNAWTFRYCSCSFFHIIFKFIDLESDETADKSYVLKAEQNLRRQELRRAVGEGRSKEYTDIRKVEVSFRANVRRFSC